MRRQAPGASLFPYTTLFRSPDGEVWAFNDFFPRSLTVARGSTIRFDIQGFHTGTILPASVSVLESFQRSEEHTSELQSPCNLVCRLPLAKKKRPHGDHHERQ